MNWGLPTGGYLDNGVTHGYYISASTSASSGDNGSENWTLQDMTGDGKPELVITGSLNGSNVQEFSPSNNSYWKVCINTIASGISEYGVSQVISVFPNPALGSVTLEAVEPFSEVRLLDGTGREVLRSSERTGRIVLPLHGLAHGTYVIRVLFTDHVVSQKVTVE